MVYTLQVPKYEGPISRKMKFMTLKEGALQGANYPMISTERVVRRKFLIKRELGQILCLYGS